MKKIKKEALQKVAGGRDETFVVYFTSKKAADADENMIDFTGRATNVQERQLTPQEQQFIGGGATWMVTGNLPPGSGPT